MDTKLKNIKGKYTNYIIYSLIVIFFASLYLSLSEVRENYRFAFPKAMYLNGEFNSEIERYTYKAIDYALYYKNEAYVKNKENITQNDIDICKSEIKNKIESETNDEINNLYNSNNFNSLSETERDRKINEITKSIEEKYKYTDEELEKYILDRKLKSFNNLSNEINSFKNINFSAYDETTKKWIYNEQKDLNTLKNNSGFYEEIDIRPNGNMIKHIYINGKNIDLEKYYNNYVDYYGHYVYENNEIMYSESKVDVDSNMGTKNSNVKIYVWTNNPIQKGDNIYSAYITAKANMNRLYISIITLILSLVMLIISIRYLKKKDNLIEIVDNVVEKIKKYPVEYKVASLVGSWIIYLIFRSTIYNNGYISWFKIENLIMLSVLFGVWYIVLRCLYLNYKEGALLKNNMSKKLWASFQVLMKNGSIFRSILLMFLLYSAIGVVLLFMAMIAYEAFFICLIVGIIVTIIFILVALKKLAYLEKIMDGAKDGAEGRLTYKIEERGQGRFRDLAHNINNMKEGLRESIQKEVKSERMKTELITNVSHDLKTPLTSIINYIDLLKRENIEPEEARDYVNVLDNKAQRLKVLIEDLFEASKAASGAMELNIEKIEIVQLLKQVLGENDERISNNGLNLKVNTPEEKIYIKGDGKRLYRVFENLISNVIKYSLANTRVYIDVIKEDENVKIIMKNIAAYELNFDVNEITERFKRADEARTSEGSGLGLAIAKSIIELHGGKFDIEIDGDLFKSIILLKNN
ncbi:Alkaline phosphatase synthesis sensor protein phoR [uncultured Clostridium sp.]|uniref:HAMP domain-containing sensor histidine kinase n=1 Tax=uncultured Clostridium sp. TaxID=59620 RepID=UPI00082194A5|nr:histidine kinase dimerization/phospho-acceptor domain-containing protein [uncultured Clostridium sp.]SCK03923.1 Alkaline phosphatase synthesis sensor protein phoR [uncultured Clostridium sp.]